MAKSLGSMISLELAHIVCGTLLVLSDTQTVVLNTPTKLTN